MLQQTIDQLQTQNMESSIQPTTKSRKQYTFQQTSKQLCTKCNKEFRKLGWHQKLLPDCTQPKKQRIGRIYDKEKYPPQYWRDACKKYRDKKRLEKIEPQQNIDL